MSPAPKKRGPKPKPKAKLLSERMTIRMLKADRRAIERLAGDMDPSEWVREQLVQILARAESIVVELKRPVDPADRTLELGDGVGRVLAVDGSVWWSPGLGQWLPMEVAHAGQGIVVGVDQDPTETIRAVRRGSHG